MDGEPIGKRFARTGTAIMLLEVVSEPDDPIAIHDLEATGPVQKGETSLTGLVSFSTDLQAYGLGRMLLTPLGNCIVRSGMSVAACAVNWQFNAGHCGYVAAR